MGQQKRPLVIALPKGPSFQLTWDVIQRVGYEFPPLSATSRKLVHESRCSTCQVVFVKDQDIPHLLQHQMVDIGFIGQDYLLENQDELCDLLDLGKGTATLCVYGKPLAESTSIKRVGSKYPKFVERYFANRNVHVEVIYLYDDHEVALLTGLVDCMFGPVESRQHVEACGLVIYEQIAPNSIHVVTTKNRLRARRTQIEWIVNRIRGFEERKYLSW